MIYDKAVQAGRQALTDDERKAWWGAVDDVLDYEKIVEIVLDAIGFGPTQSLLDNALAYGIDMRQANARFAKERDTARALADRLAAELTDKMGGGVDLWMDAELIADWEARDWK